ncbi:MAG: ABC transporter ATP-binding protein [Ruminococcus sp.]|nr:ABC transporter ATP-binding protein [Ruminococcus sp.]
MSLKPNLKDKETYKWLWKNSKSQHFKILTLVVGNGIFAASAIVFSLMCKGIVDGAVNHNKSELIHYGIGMFAVIMVQLLMVLYCNSITEYIRCKLAMKMRSEALDTIFKKEYQHIAGFHSGELLNRMFSDVQIITDGVTSIVPHLINLLTRLICAVAVLIVLDPSFTLVFVISGLLLFFVTRLFRKKMKSLHKDVQEKEGKVRSFLQEAVENVLIVKVFGCEKQMEDTNTENQNIHFKAQMKRRTLSIAANAGFSFVFHMGYLFAMVWGARGIYLGIMTYGTLTAILQLVNQIQQPFANLSGLLPRIYGVLASSERIMDIEKLPDEAPAEKTLDYDSFEKITTQDMSFSYGDNHVLCDVNFDINKGDFISLTGLSGGGKSTLFLLLLGAYKAQSGELVFKSDDGDFHSGKETRHLFAYVPQGNFLFSGTIEENIRMLNKDATDEMVIEAAKIACAYDFIESLPYKLDTRIGENGTGISEGQAQRIAIARAILSNAPILLLDEATSALDETTEAQLLKNIASLKNRTCLIVTHRPAALKICSKHLIINEGKMYYGEV